MANRITHEFNNILNNSEIVSDFYAKRYLSKWNVTSGTLCQNEIIPVSDKDAMTAGRMMGRREGVLIGISSGACLHAAMELAKREENAGKTIVALMPDCGDRYLSTALYQE